MHLKLHLSYTHKIYNVRFSKLIFELSNTSLVFDIELILLFSLTFYNINFWS